MNDDRQDLVRAVPGPLLGGGGELDPALRRAAFDRGGGRPGDVALPEPLGRFVDKVTTEAYKVVDGDIVELRAAGYREDAVLEAVLAAAIGAGLARLEIGLAALGR
ncbi:MAG TPA: hypothetical protein VL337_16300 [Acidimicrobiales bacterium]|jgi:hypothetical protein|nr:hypothetical protein [Acidimicrobiales bacterium]